MPLCGYAHEGVYVSIDVINSFRENTKNHTKCQQQQKSILSQILLIATENVIIARGQEQSYMNMSLNN